MPVEKLGREGCQKLGLYPLSGQTQVAGENYCYNWDYVRDAATSLHQNLESYICLPLAARLSQKGLKSPVTFWFAPMGDQFVITVCSKRSVNFMNPLHSLRGYAGYGSNYLRPNARPFLHYDGKCITRVHKLDAPSDARYFVADFGSGFGLNIAETDEDQFCEISESPLDYFEYSVVPVDGVESVSWNGQDFVIYHALCVTG